MSALSGLLEVAMVLGPEGVTCVAAAAKAARFCMLFRPAETTDEVKRSRSGWNRRL